MLDIAHHEPIAPANDEPAVPRWRAALTYRHDDGPRTKFVFVEEISDLEAIVEAGPDWNALLSILITLNRRSASSGWTVEQAAAA